jgi:hypothetical protein
MQNKKILYIEIIILVLFFCTISSIILTIGGYIAGLRGIILTSIWGIVYVGLLGWYSCIEDSSLHIKTLIALHSIPLLVLIPFFDIITKCMIIATLFLGIEVLLTTFRNIIASEKDHIKFRAKTIILPHTSGLVIWLMLLASILVYGNTIKTNPNGIILDESFISSQVTALNPLLKEVAPGVNIQGSVGNYIEGQIREQSLGVKVTNQDEIVKQQVTALSEKFGISLNPDTPIAEGFVSYVNKFLKPWMSGPIWGALVSFVVFLSLIPFVGWYQTGIRFAIHIIHRNAIKYKFINLHIKNIEKETIIL